jgi:hypothetical protein
MAMAAAIAVFAAVVPMGGATLREHYADAQEAMRAAIAALRREDLAFEELYGQFSSAVDGAIPGNGDRDLELTDLHELAISLLSQGHDPQTLLAVDDAIYGSSRKANMTPVYRARMSGLSGRAGPCRISLMREHEVARLIEEIRQCAGGDVVINVPNGATIIADTIQLKSVVDGARQVGKNLMLLGAADDATLRSSAAAVGLHVVTGPRELLVTVRETPARYTTSSKDPWLIASTMPVDTGLMKLTDYQSIGGLLGSLEVVTPPNLLVEVPAPTKDVTLDLLATTYYMGYRGCRVAVITDSTDVRTFADSIGLDCFGTSNPALSSVRIVPEFMMTHRGYPYGTIQQGYPYGTIQQGYPYEMGIAYPDAPGSAPKEGRTESDEPQRASWLTVTRLTIARVLHGVRRLLSKS